MFKKTFVSAVVGAAALGLSGVALAGGGAYTPAACPAAKPFQPGFIVGLQLGVGNTHMRFYAPGHKGAHQYGFGGRVYAGYKFTKNLGVQAGFTYITKTKLNGVTGGNYTYKDAWVADIVGVLSAGGVGTSGIMDTGIGVYAKAGIGYAHGKWSKAPAFVPVPGGEGVGSSTVHSFNLVYGGGLTYTLPDMKNLAFDVSYMSHLGRYKRGPTGKDTQFMQATDLYSLGVQYLFNV